MKIIYFTFFLLLLYSCTSVQEAGKVLRNEKVKTTDEFLVEKRDPLVLPPDYKEIPEPDSMKIKNSVTCNSIIKTDIIFRDI